MYDLPLAVTSLVVTGYMLAGAAGMVAVVSRARAASTRDRRLPARRRSALALVATGWLPGLAAAMVASAAGFGTGWPARRATC